VETGFIKKLMRRWKVESPTQAVIILVVFACTGFSVMFLKKPITNWFYSDPESDKTLFSILYWILIFPVYNILLLFYGFVFGQFQFFWAFEKGFFKRILGKGERKKSSSSTTSY
jgi:hypothetical protein